MCMFAVEKHGKRKLYLEWAHGIRPAFVCAERVNRGCEQSLICRRHSAREFASKFELV